MEVSLKRTLDNPTTQAHELGFDWGVYANYQNCPSMGRNWDFTLQICVRRGLLIGLSKMKGPYKKEMDKKLV